MKNEILEKLQTLQKSKFRSKFKLSQKDCDYIKQKGLDVIESHCRDFVSKRLTDKSKFVDGKQTPMRGHPVFTAQHATATCCRECLHKWHKIEPNHILTQAEQDYITEVIMTWITSHLD